MVHRKWLPWLACAVIAAIGFPALAQGESESAKAADPPATASFSLDDNGFWDASGADHADTEVEVATGGTVTWNYAQGAGGLPHTVQFDGTRPASCTSSPSIPVQSDTLPQVPLNAPWTASCTFPSSGTFTFHCSVHPTTMKGTVKVTDVGTATPTPTGTATETPTPTVSATPTPVATPVAAAKVTAHDNSFENANVTIKPGEYVHFSYPDGTASHNVDFKDATQPACEQTAPLPAVGASPPLPKYTLPKGWAGDCKFDTPGTYSFVCDAHPSEMKGTVTVAEPPVAQPAVVRDNTVAPAAKPWASLYKPTAKSSQLAVLLKGKLKLTARCAAVSKGTLTLTVSKTIAKQLKLKSTTLATGSGTCNGNNRFSATLKPTAAAKRALKRHRKAIKATATLRFGATKTTHSITLAGIR